MIAGSDFDRVIASRVLNHAVKQVGSEIIEETPEGDRALRPYSSEIGAAWEVVQAMGITIVPIEGQSWFALVGPALGWKSPAQLIECVQKGDFAHSGAAVSESAPLSICLAALSATEKRMTELSTAEAASLQLN